MAPKKEPRIKYRAIKNQGGTARRVNRPSRTPSPPPSPPPPPPVPSWVAQRLSELSEVNLRIYYERGFLMTEKNALYRDQYVTECVKPWGWDTFVEQPTVQVPVKLIHEFVANFPDEDSPETVVVRGVPVNISAAKINELYGFTYPMGGYDFYLTILNDRHLPLTYQTIADVLCGDRKKKGYWRGSHHNDEETSTNLGQIHM